MKALLYNWTRWDSFSLKMTFICEGKRQKPASQGRFYRISIRHEISYSNTGHLWGKGHE